MNWLSPFSPELRWPTVDEATFEQILAPIDFRRDAFGDAAPYYVKHSGRLFAVAFKDGTIRVHPQMLKEYEQEDGANTAR